MQVIAKSKFNQNIYDKVLKGAEAIELHLDEDFIANPIPWDEQIVKDVQIVAVHAPLLYGDNDTNIEDFHNRQILVKTCDLARRIAETQNHSVMIICHLGTDPEVLKGMNIYDDLVIFMRNLAINYEQLEFAVENVTPFDGSTSSLSNHIGFKSVGFDSSVKFVKDVDHPRVGTCLDTCHAMMETELMRWMRMYLGFKQDDVDKFKPTNIEDFFEENKDTIKWMHLANSKSHGLGKCHGLPFTELDIDCLRNILRLYRKYKYNCPMVIEVREEDYSDAKNYATTCQMLDMVLQELE